MLTGAIYGVGLVEVVGYTPWRRASPSRMLPAVMLTRLMDLAIKLLFEN